MRCQTEIVTRSSSSFCTFYKVIEWLDPFSFLWLGCILIHFFCACWNHECIKSVRWAAPSYYYTFRQNIFLWLSCLNFSDLFIVWFLSVCEAWLVSVTSWKDFYQNETGVYYFINANCWSQRSHWEMLRSGAIGFHWLYRCQADFTCSCLRIKTSKSTNCAFLYKV